MNKAVMLPIKPQWFSKIVTGKKKMEFRNYEIEVGMKIYFYESLGNKKSIDKWEDYPLYYCHRDDKGEGKMLDFVSQGSGHIVGEAIVDDVYVYEKYPDLYVARNTTYEMMYDDDMINAHDTFEPYEKEKIGCDCDNPQSFAMKLKDIIVYDVPKAKESFYLISKIENYRKAMNKLSLRFEGKKSYENNDELYEKIQKWFKDDMSNNDYLWLLNEFRVTHVPQSRIYVVDIEKGELVK